MELYSMPQLDKSSYSDIHYVERSNLPNTSIPVDVKKFSPVSGDILTSSAWSAVIHRPAEDSEPEDLPSTVDMDAIKGSPTTSLPTSGPLGWSESDQGHVGGLCGDDGSESGDDDDDEEEDDGDEEDEDEENDKEDSSSDNESSSRNTDGDDADSESGTAKGSASDSDSESSSRNSVDSDSDSASSDSSCSSQSSESSHSSSCPTPVREPEKTGSKSRIGAHRNEKKDEKVDIGTARPLTKDDKKQEEPREITRKDDERQHRKESLSLNVKEEHADQKWPDKKEIVRNPDGAKVGMVEDRLREKIRESPAKPAPSRGSHYKDVEPQVLKSVGKFKGSTSDVPYPRTVVNAISASSSLASRSCKDHKKNEEKKLDRKTSTSISSSTTQTSSTVNSTAIDSFSDVELPDQVVNDAIKRIQVDAKGKSGPSTATLEEDDDENVSEDEDSSDDDGRRRAHYSSSLLQKFVENTERLSGKRTSVQTHILGSKHRISSGANRFKKDSARPKHTSQFPSTGSLRCTEPPAGPHRAGPADLEVYCSVSNVSPDSGIYCVNGSPWHQSSPAHSPQHPPQQLLKGLPSPPRSIVNQDQKRKHVSSKVATTSSSKSSSMKSSSHKMEHIKDARVPPILSVDDSDDETSSSSLLLPAPARRGRGRPRKVPPVLEPCLPHSLKSSSNRLLAFDRGQGKSRKQTHKKESESSDQSLERCDKILTYSKHRSREVQVTSQGVQCDQSEFPQVGLSESKKKKKNLSCQSYQVKPVKSCDFFKKTNYSGQPKEKLQRKMQTACDRVKKTSDSYSFQHAHGGQPKPFPTHLAKDVGLLKRTSLGEQDSSSPSCSKPSSTSKRRLPTGVEKRKKGRRRVPAAHLAAAAATILSSSTSTAVKPEIHNITAQSATSSSSVRSSKTLSNEKVVVVPQGLKHHKHKKRLRQKERKKRSSRSSFIDPTFLQELEKLMVDFQRSCCIARIQQPSRLAEGTRLPSIFRVKRILKKRKGSERSKTSDRDSGPEAEDTNPPVTPAPRDSRDKGSTGGKRRPKKGAIETPKGQRPEANNEQRLPLKKRHYHMSATPNQQSALSSSPEISLDISSSAEDKKSNNDDSPTSSTSSKASVMSTASQGSRENPALCNTNLLNKTDSGFSNTLSDVNLLPSVINGSGKTPVSGISNMNSRFPLVNACAIKGNLPSAAGTSTKISVVMPATSSSLLAEPLLPNESSILSKADLSDTFASVCGRSDSRLGRLSLPSAEKTYPPPLAVTCTSSLYEAQSSCSQNSPQGTSPTSSVLTSTSQGKIAPKPLQASEDCELVSKPNNICGTVPKVSSSKNTSTVPMKTISAVTQTTVKSVADSSVVAKSSEESIMNRALTGIDPLRDKSHSCAISSVVDAIACAPSLEISANFSTAQSLSAKTNILNPVSGVKFSRNSYDEAIEACISKYSSDVPSANVAPRSVITTPKKRHRIEMQGKPVGGKGREVDANVHSTTGSATGAQTLKKVNARSVASAPGALPTSLVSESAQPFVQTDLPPTQPSAQALSPGGSKMPESGIFEPSSSSEHYVVNVSLPATPVKSVIAGLSKLKGAGSGTTYRSISMQPTMSECASLTEVTSDSYSLTSHNLRQKKNILGLSSEADAGLAIEDTMSEEGPIMAESTPEIEPILSTKSEMDGNVKVKSKSKSKQKIDLENRNCCLEAKTEAEMRAKEKGSLAENDSNVSDLKELRIHVEKLTSADISSQKGKDKSSKQQKNSVPKRRRKCNRTGFPVKRKKKKKELSEDLKAEEEKVKLIELSVDCSDSASQKTAQISPSSVGSTECSISNLEPHCEDEQNKNLGSSMPGNNYVSEDALSLKEEILDDAVNVTGVEKNREGAMTPKFENCLKNSEDSKDIKPEAKHPETASPVPLNSASSDVKSPGQHDDFQLVPYTDRLPNKEKYMYAGFSKRLDAKANNKVRKPSKAVLRAMRAKFSENITLPDLPLGSSMKGSKCMPPNWSSDESDVSIDDPYEFTETPPPAPVDCDENSKCGNSEGAIKPEISEESSKHKKGSSGKRPKRDIKRPALPSCDEPVKSKYAKSEKEGSNSASASKTKPNLIESRTRNKRKNEIDDLLTSAELRTARSKKRLRTNQKIDTDSLETDCDESVVGDPPMSSTGVAGDAISEDETSKNDLKDAKQPRWRKKYLPAGLFSDYFKLDEPRPVSDGKKGLQYKPEDHPHGLLPPPYHCGKWLRQRRVNFQLPYDLWWLHTHSKLPGRDIVPSWNYKKLRTNVYNNVKPSYVHEPQSCNCKSPEDGNNGCGDDCINRLVYTECSPSICPLKDLCSNQKIQRHEWAPGLERFMTKEKGWGVRAKLPIKSGEFILEYVGEVVSDKEFKDRMATIYTKDTHHYCLHLDGGLVIDGHRMGGDGRFVNHSCEPNCEMQKWSVNGLFRMALFALRDIDANEELGYDYNFSLFNAAEGQPCKCGSTQCRGVIGGKSQRVNVLPSSQNGSSSKVSVEDISEKKGSRKSKRKASRKNDKEQAAENMRQRKRVEAQRLSQLLTLNIRQMSHQQRSFVQQHHCFLLRNLEKVRRLKEKLKQASQRAESFTRPAQSNVKQSDVFLTQLNALSIPRNVRTRRLAQAEDNPELARNARLACVLRDLFISVVSAKDENGEALSAPFMTLPNKRKLPLYYVRIREPLDFSTVEQNINSGLYCTLEAFDQDICKILQNNLRFYGRTTKLGIASVRLKKMYLDAKKEAYPQLVDVLGETLPASFVAEKDPAEEEDVIRCICGLYRDEGMMIQCERCLVWQHCDCVKADSTFEHYLCEICQPRPIDLEIPMDPQPSHSPDGQTEYLTLLRSDLQIRQGDTVYVLRDVTEGEGESQAKVTYKTIKDPKYGDMDIFRIERLWKDDKGERFAFGHHYLRPHETYHEPTRKFYPNEVMRVPLYEIISLDLIWARCWVLDPMTYCKGRPIEAVEEHVYICEYRVDKTAHLFYKISKSQSRANLCLKSYAFETFEARLKPVRTYTPHGPVPPLKPRVRGSQDDASSTKSMPQSSSIVAEEEEEVPLARVRDTAVAEKREKQRCHLNGILLRLLANQQCKQPLDMSYLLDPGRRPRKKPASLNT